MYEVRGERLGAAQTASSATQAAQKILMLAAESVDMLRSVSSVSKDGLDRTDMPVPYPLPAAVFSAVHAANTHSVAG